MSKRENHRINKLTNRVKQLERTVYKTKKSRKHSRKPHKNNENSKKIQKLYKIKKILKEQMPSFLEVTLVWFVILSLCNISITEYLNNHNITQTLLTNLINVLGIFIPLWVTKEQIIIISKYIGLSWYIIIVSIFILILLHYAFKGMPMLPDP